jgi:hypothetical protein
MSTQSARNIVRTQLDMAISRAKSRIKEEGKKKITELKKEIPTPQELAKKLLADITPDTCSAEGVEKFNKIFTDIENKLTNISNITSTALDTLTKIEEKLNDIIDSVEEGPVGKLNQMITSLRPIVQVLQYAIVLSALLYAANSGPSGSGTAQAQIDDTKRTAESKVGEYLALFTMIPLMIGFYINEARKTTIPLVFLKNKLQFIKDIVTKLRHYILSLYLTFEEGCNNLTTGGNNNGGGTTTPPEPTELDKYLAYLAEQYDDVYQQLYASGNALGLQRIFTLKENFEENYNISFKTINIVDPNDPTLNTGSPG